MSTTSKTLRWLQDELFGHATSFRGGGFAAASRAFLKRRTADKPLEPMPGAGANQFGRQARSANSWASASSVGRHRCCLFALTLVTPFALRGWR